MTDVAHQIPGGEQLAEFISRGSNFAMLMEQGFSRSKGSGYIFHGPAGIGKGILAAQFAKSILCEHARGTAASCGQCTTCIGYSDFGSFWNTRWDAKDPDYEGKLDQIRTFAWGPRLDEEFIVVIENVDALKQTLLDQMLKVLEDSTVTFLFTAVELSGVRKTIRSRCTEFRVSPISHAESVDFIRMLDQGQPRLEAEIAKLLADLAEGRPRELAELVADAQSTGCKTRESFMARRGLDWPTRLAPGWPVILARGNLNDLSACLRAVDPTERLRRAQSLLVFLKPRDSGSDVEHLSLDPALRFLTDERRTILRNQFQAYASLRNIEVNALWKALAWKWLEACA